MLGLGLGWMPIYDHKIANGHAIGVLASYGISSKLLGMEGGVLALGHINGRIYFSSISCGERETAASNFIEQKSCI